MQDRNRIHEDYIVATNFLGRLYRAHEDLIVADPANHITHLQSHDEDLERVRKCFKRLETFMVSDNYFRSVSGLPPAPYLDQPLTQLALKQNNSDHLTKLARLEVDSILRTLEQPGMYVDGSATSNQSPPMTPARSGLQQGTPSRWTAMSALMDLKEGYNSIQTSERQDTGPGPMKHNPPLAFCPINRPSSSVQVSSSPQVTHTQGMALLETQSTQEMTLHRPTPMHIMDPAVTAITSAKTILCVQLTNTPVSFASTTQVRMDVPIPPTVNSVAPSTSMEPVPILQNPGVSSMVNAQGTSQPQDHNIDPCRKCGKKNHKTDKCKKKTSCKKCKSKEHKTMFCTVDPVPDQLCTFCGKSKHTAECCRACKKAEKKARAQESGAARSNASNPLTTTT